MAGGLAGIAPPGETELLEYPCPAGDFVSSISRYPFIVLRADNGNQLRTLAAAAGERGLPRNVFTATMLGASAEDQINPPRTRVPTSSTTSACWSSARPRRSTR
nr:DUF2000 family protein [Microbispora rosea]